MPISEEAHFLVAREACENVLSVVREECNGTLAVAPRLAELETERVRARAGMEDDWANPRATSMEFKDGKNPGPSGIFPNDCTS